MTYFETIDMLVARIDAAIAKLPAVILTEEDFNLLQDVWEAQANLATYERNHR